MTSQKNILNKQSKYFPTNIFADFKKSHLLPPPHPPLPSMKFFAQISRVPVFQNTSEYGKIKQIHLKKKVLIRRWSDLFLWSATRLMPRTYHDFENMEIIKFNFLFTKEIEKILNIRYCS